MKRLSVLFLCTFAVLVGAAFAWQALVQAPGDRCEAGGQWWDPQTRICAQPIYIPNITGRLPGESRAEASDRKNRELLETEAEAARQQQALEAEIARQQAAAQAAPAK